LPARFNGSTKYQDQLQLCASPANLPQNRLGFEADFLWDCEGGVKTYFLERRLYLDFTYYHIDWSNQHINAIAQGAFEYPLNAGKTTNPRPDD
jgi:hypothetical protein